MTRLRPLIGAATGLLIGTGVAIGSGIFRNPGLVAEHVQTPIWIMAAWLFGGVFFILAGLAMAEMATRYPRAGGEYVFLRHVYGDFVAFFFGWAYTIFVVGCGLATMAAAFGDFACDALGTSTWQYGAAPDAAIGLSRPFAAAAIALITAVNLAGLRTGAVTQNLLTLLKVAALLAIVAAGFLRGSPVDWLAAASPPATSSTAPAGLGVGAALLVFAGAMMPVMWSYEGTTDSVKMTEEIRNPRRSMPAALAGAGVLVTIVYLLLNWAFLRVVTPAEMSGSNMVAADVLLRLFGPVGKALMLLLAMMVVLGAISSSIVSCVRVPFALGRDGMTFRFMGRMSAGQAPVGALLVSAALAIAFALSGKYGEVLSIYTISTGVLFGLVNLSLFVLRVRERSSPVASGDHFRCPFGKTVSLFLAGVQFVIAGGTAVTYPKQAAYTGVILVVVALLYLVWKSGAESLPEE